MWILFFQFCIWCHSLHYPGLIWCSLREMYEELSHCDSHIPKTLARTRHPRCSYLQWPRSFFYICPFYCRSITTSPINSFNSNLDDLDDVKNSICYDIDMEDGDAQLSTPAQRPDSNLSVLFSPRLGSYAKDGEHELPPAKPSRKYCQTQFGPI